MFDTQNAGSIISLERLQGRGSANGMTDWRKEDAELAPSHQPFFLDLD